MSNADYSNIDLDGDEFVDGDVVGNLRKALKAQQKAAKAKDDEIATLKTEVSGLRGQVTQTTLSSLLEAKGAKPGLSKFMSGVEATEESVAAWLAENGEFFGYDPEAKPAEKTADPAAPAEPVVKLDPEMEAILSSMKKVQNQEANAAPGLSPGEDTQLEFLNRVGKNATSFEDVENALRQAGMFNLSSE